MATIDQQIKANLEKIDANSRKISALKATGNDWINDANNDVCDQKLKNKRDACNDEKTNKLKKGNDYIAEASVLESINSQLQDDIKELTKQRAAEGQAMIELAKTGTTTAAEQTKAEGQASAASKLAAAQGQAILTKSTADAATTAEESKQRTMITIVVVAIVLLVLAVIVAKKLKKIKK